MSVGIIFQKSASKWTFVNKTVKEPEINLESESLKFLTIHFGIRMSSTEGEDFHIKNKKNS